MTILFVIGAALAGGLLSLIGGILLLNKRVSRDKIILYAMPFGAGALLGAAFFSVLPEALHYVNHMSHEHHAEQVVNEEEHRHDEAAHEEEHTHGEEHSEALASTGNQEDGSGGDGLASTILALTLVGFVLFFIMERTIRWFHRHHEHGAATSQKSLIIFGDTIHNAIDGMAIGAAFLVNIPLGIATTIAVAAHEIPQEIGDFGILLSRGMARKKVLIVNILSSLATVVTAVLTFYLADSVELAVPVMLALVAGFFIYIAASDIIPDIHEQPQKRANIQAVLLIVGIAIIPLTALVLESVFGLTHSH